MAADQKEAEDRYQPEDIYEPERPIDDDSSDPDVCKTEAVKF